MREATRQEGYATLLGLSLGRQTLEGAVVGRDRIGEATVPEGGRAGGEIIWSIRMHCGDWWKRHG